MNANELLSASIRVYLRFLLLFSIFFRRVRRAVVVQLSPAFPWRSWRPWRLNPKVPEKLG
jgi:hypothetical protein